MKTTLTTLTAVLFWFLPLTISSAIPVTDSLHIASNRLNAKKDLLEQLLQGATQEEQLANLHSQIQQIDDFLSRIGKLEDVHDLPGFDRVADDFLRELNLPSWEILANLSVEELFKVGNGTLYGKVNKDIIIDGKKVGEISAEAVKPELASRRAFEQYETIRDEVIVQRAVLKGELDTAMLQLRAATTTAEVQKLTAIINALGAQIAATDSEMNFASQEVVARYYQNQVEHQIQEEVKEQQDMASFKTGFLKTLEAFSMPSEPALFQPRNKQ